MFRPPLLICPTLALQLTVLDIRATGSEEARDTKCGSVGAAASVSDVGGHEYGRVSKEQHGGAA
jgi:hypothetical protein